MGQVSGFMVQDRVQSAESRMQGVGFRVSGILCMV